MTESLESNFRLTTKNLDFDHQHFQPFDHDLDLGQMEYYKLGYLTPYPRII